MLISQNVDTGKEEQLPWWALYTRHQHEKAVAERLSAKGFEVFLPLYESISHWKDRSKKLSLPLFPCYVFVRGGLNRRLEVVTTPGIHSVLSSGEGVALIPEEEIRAIRKLVEAPCRVNRTLFWNAASGFESRVAASKALKGFWFAKESVPSGAFRRHAGAVGGSGN